MSKQCGKGSGTSVKPNLEAFNQIMIKVSEKCSYLISLYQSKVLEKLFCI